MHYSKSVKHYMNTQENKSSSKIEMQGYGNSNVYFINVKVANNSRYNRSPIYAKLHWEEMWPTIGDPKKVMTTMDEENI